MITTEASLIAHLKLRKDLLEEQRRRTLDFNERNRELSDRIIETSARIQQSQTKLISETDWREIDTTLDRVFQAVYGKTQDEIVESAFESLHQDQLRRR